MTTPTAASLLIALLCLSIYFIYFIAKTERPDRYSLGKLVIYILFMVFMFCKLVYYKNKIPFGEPPDEVVHYSYVEYVKNSHSFIPEFDKMYMYNNPKQGNYLGHPPLYYLFLSFDIDAGDTLAEKVSKERNISILLTLLSLLLIFSIAYPMRMHLLAHVAYLTTICSLPMFAYLGASINNDNLAILGGVVFTVGLAGLMKSEKRKNFPLFLLALGLFLAFFGKLTAALLTAFAFFAFIVIHITRRPRIPVTKFQMTILLIFLLPVLSYQLYIIMTYHSIMPSFSITHPEQYLKSGFWIPEASRTLVSPYDWLLSMRNFVIKGWFAIHSHHSIPKSSITQYMGLLLLHLMAVIAFFLNHKKELKHFGAVGRITLFSLFSVMVVQYFFSYQNHLNTGYHGGLQPRYLLPFMTSFGILASLLVDRYSRHAGCIIAIVIICGHALYSDLFYFIQHYR